MITRTRNLVRALQCTLIVGSLLVPTTRAAPPFDTDTDTDLSVPAHLRPEDPSASDVAQALDRIRHQISDNQRVINRTRSTEFIIHCRWAGGVAVASDTDPGLVICFDRTMFNRTEEDQ